MTRTRILGVICVLVLMGILAAGLAPFGRPRNKVTWLGNENGLRFRRYGTVWSSGTFPVTGANNEPSCTLEIWMQPGRRDASSSSTVLAFYAPENPLRLLVHQYRAMVILTREITDGQRQTQVIGIKDVFRETKPVFVTITSGNQNTSMYIDGRLARLFRSFRLGDACTGRLVVGTSPRGNDSWVGQLRGLAIYERELSAAQVLRHFETWTTQGRPEISGDEEAMAVYLFGERSGNVVHDTEHRGIDLYIPRRFSLLDQPLLKPFWKEFKPRSEYAIDVLVNICGFIPLGFFFYAYWSFARPIQRPALTTVALGLAVSLTIEVLQSYLPTRDSGTTDLITNTVGTFVGVRLCASKAVRGLLAKLDLAAFS